MREQTGFLKRAFKHQRFPVIRATEAYTEITVESYTPSADAGLPSQPENFSSL